MVFVRVRDGKEFVKFNFEFSYVVNFLYMLRGELLIEVEVEVFNKVLILYVDYEFNVFVFMVCCVVFLLLDMYLGVVVVIGLLKGLLYGGVNEWVMLMFKEIGSIDNVDYYLDERFVNKDKIMGFGYCVYKDGDLRVKYLREMSCKIIEEIG